MKLMILAQPKTASTSLMHAVGELSGMKFAQWFQLKLSQNGGASALASFRETYPALDYPALSFFHSDIADFSGFGDLETILAADVCKQHFPPTESNIKLLKRVPKIVLIRDPQETIDSYRRVKGLGLNIYRLLGDESFCKRLRRELEAWQYGWLLEAKNDPGTLVFSKDDIVNDTRDAMGLIMLKIGIDNVHIPSNFELPKKRYSNG